MKSMKFAAIALLLAGGFACTNDGNTNDDNLVSIKIQDRFTGAFDPNIVSFALPGIVEVICHESPPYPDYGSGGINVWSPHFWTIKLIMAEGTDVTSLAPKRFLTGRRLTVLLSTNSANG